MMPKYVSGAMAAFRSACFQITLDSRNPLVRAKLINSLSIISSIDDRISRISAATRNQPIDMAGRMYELTPWHCEVGTSSSCTAKIHIITSPSQNGGNDCPISAMVLPTQSKIVSFLTADSTPMGMATSSENTMATAANCMVVGNRSSTILMASWSGYLIDSPNSPRKLFRI